MPRVESTVEVGAPITVAVALSQTYGELRYRWDPFVCEQHLLDEATTAGAACADPAIVRAWPVQPPPD